MQTGGHVSGLFREWHRKICFSAFTILWADESSELHSFYAGTARSRPTALTANRHGDTHIKLCFRCRHRRSPRKWPSIIPSTNVAIVIPVTTISLATGRKRWSNVILFLRNCWRESCVFQRMPYLSSFSFSLPTTVLILIFWTTVCHNSSSLFVLSL